MWQPTSVDRWPRSRVALLALPLALSLAGRREALADAPPAFAESREVLSTGTDVPGFGTIGGDGLYVLGIDNSGRVLIAGDISDGRQGLYWADGQRVTPVWTSDDPDARRVFAQGWWADTDGAGNVVVADADEIFRVSPGPPRRVARVGDTDGSGNVFCGFSKTKINTAGEVAFQAALAPGEGPSDCWSCTEYEQCEYGVFVTDGAQLTRIGSGDGEDHTIDLVGITLGGEVIVTEWTTADDGNTTVAIRAVKGGAARTLVRHGDLGPGGTPLALWGYRVASNDIGEVVFQASDNEGAGVYRTDRGRIVQVVGPEGPPAHHLDGFETSYEMFMNHSGDVLLTAYWADDVGQPANGLLMVRSDGTTQFVLTEGPGALATSYLANSYLNDACEVALMTSRRPGALEASRWRDGSRTEVLRTGSPAPGGGVFAMMGILYPSCLGRHGEVGAIAQSTDGFEGVLCVDQGGAHLVSRESDPAPMGESFLGFSQCEFGGDGELFFGGLTPGQPEAGGPWQEGSVFRARADGLERIVGPRDRAADGSILGTPYHWISDARSFDWFVTNARGSVLVAAPADTGPGLFFRRAGGVLERIDYSQLLTSGADTSVTFGLTDDDTVFLTTPANWANGPQTLASWHDGELRIITRVDDPILPGAPFERFANLLASGLNVVFAGENELDSSMFLYRPGDPSPERILAPGAPLPFGPLGKSWPWALSSGGRLLFSALPAGADPADVATLIYDHGGVHQLPKAPWDCAGALCLNDRGNVLFQKILEDPISTRQSLILAGPPPDGAGCPAPPTAVPRTPPTRIPTATITRPPTRTSRPTRTLSPTPTLRPGEIRPSLVIGSTAGMPGQRVEFSVRLAAPQDAVIAIVADMAFAEGAFAANVHEKPDCRVNLSGALLMATGWRPQGCTPDHDCTGARVALVDLDLAPMPDEADVFTCAIGIAPDAQPGAYPLSCSFVELVDPSSNDLLAGCVPGSIAVHGSADPSNADASIAQAGAAVDGRAGDAAATMDGAGTGCGIVSARSPSSAYWLALPAMLMWLGRGAAGSDGSWGRRASRVESRCGAVVSAEVWETPVQSRKTLTYTCASRRARTCVPPMS